MSQIVKSTPKTPVKTPENFRVPNIDITEESNEFLIKAEMPGIKESDIHVEYDQGRLTISGKAEKSEEKSEKNYRYKQFESMDFFRSFRVGESVKSDEITAGLKDGVLCVHLPKSDALKPRKIELKK